MYIDIYIFGSILPASIKSVIKNVLANILFLVKTMFKLATFFKETKINKKEEKNLFYKTA